MEDLTRLLRAHPYLEALDDAQIAVIVGCAKNVRFDAGDHLMREGDVARAFFLLRVGRVSLDVHIPGKEPLRAETVEPGEIVGLSWLFEPYRVNIDARALEPVVALSFDGGCLRGKMDADPALGYAITRRVLASTISRLERVRLQRLDVFRAP